MAHLQISKLPFRDINVKVSPDSYIFTSPSSPDAPSLVIDRPTGDLRLSEGNASSAKRASRVSSIAGILGVIQLRLGWSYPCRDTTPNLDRLVKFNNNFADNW
jgi:phosphatidylinositol 4-phosphatase